MGKWGESFLRRPESVGKASREDEKVGESKLIIKAEKKKK